MARPCRPRHTPNHPAQRRDGHQPRDRCLVCQHPRQRPSPKGDGLQLPAAIGASAPLLLWIVFSRYGPPAPGEPYSPAQRVVGTAIAGSYMAFFVGVTLVLTYIKVPSGFGRSV
jgi:hypothetical protein